jgi:hypothetical protein
MIEVEATPDFVAWFEDLSPGESFARNVGRVRLACSMRFLLAATPS